MITADTLSTWASVATALGTLALAVATYLLAVGATREVKAANAQARASVQQSAASLKQSEASLRQAEAAERGLALQTAPLLSDVPFGIPVVSGYQLKPSSGPSIFSSLYGHREPTYRDASEISLFIDEHGLKDANVEVPFRNVANGVAIVTEVVFVTVSGTEVSGVSSTPVVPPSQIAKATLSTLPTEDAYESARSIINQHESFSVVVAYGDATGTPRGAIRLDVAPATVSPDGDGWFIRQVHWGDTPSEVRESPRVSSRPAIE